MPRKDLESQKIYNKRWYAKNKRRTINRVLRNRKKRLQELEPIVNKLKDKPCTVCRNKYHPVAMDFDHVRGKKLMSISEMVRSGYSVKKVMTEIKKCEVVCAVCHRIRTHMQRLAKKR